MWPNPQETAGLVIVTDEILNGKLHFLCSEACFCLLKISLASNWLFELNNKYTKPANLLREDSIADVFLWILKSFQEQLEQVQVTVFHKVKNKI